MNNYLLNFYLDFKSLTRLVHPLLSNVLSVMLDRPNRLAPLYVAWMLTYKCNCRCRHCSNRYDSAWVDNRDIAKELKTAEALRIAHEIGQSKIWGVSLTGGDPLMRDDIFEVVKVLKKHGKVINLGTNGEFLKRYADEIINSKIDTISISVDSHRPEIHDYLRARPGLFQKVIEGIEKIKRYGKPKIKVKCVISKKNFLDMEDYIKFWRDRVDQVVFQPIQNTCIHQTQDRELLINQELEAVMEDLIRKFPFMNNPYYRYMPLFLSDPQELVVRKIFRCFYRSNFALVIDPYGSVQPCYGIESQIIGNVKEENIIDLWKKPQTFKFQQALRAKNCNCICWEDSNFLNLYLVRFFNLTEKLFFWKKFPIEGIKIENEKSYAESRTSN